MPTSHNASTADPGDAFRQRQDGVRIILASVLAGISWRVLMADLAKFVDEYSRLSRLAPGEQNSSEP